MKKTLTIVMAMVLVAAVAITGTLAYMSTQSGTVTNTFTFGNMSITLKESPVDDNGKKVTGDLVDKNDYIVIPGAEVDKEPIVTVNANSESCWVYVGIQNNVLVDGKEVADYKSYIVDANWEKVEDAALAAKHVTVYKHKTAVANSATDTPLSAVFTKVKFDGEKITLDNIDDLQNSTIVIKAYAHQSESLDSTFDVDAAAIAHFTTEFGA